MNTNITTTATKHGKQKHIGHLNLSAIFSRNIADSLKCDRRIFVLSCFRILERFVVRYDLMPRNRGIFELFFYHAADLNFEIVFKYPKVKTLPYDTILPLLVGKFPVRCWFCSRIATDINCILTLCKLSHAKVNKLQGNKRILAYIRWKTFSQIAFI